MSLSRQTDPDRHGRAPPLLTRNPIPAYHRIFQVLRQRIIAGQHPVGTQLPTEDALMQEFGVSRHTVRAALQQLVAQGLLLRQAGRGSFVRDPLADGQQWAAQSLEDMLGNSFGGGLDSPAKRTLRASDPMTAAARQALGTAQPVVCFSWRRTGPEGPYSQAFVYLPKSMADQVPRDWSGQMGSTRLLHLVERCCGVQAHRVRQRSSAIAADEDVAGRLEIAAGSPLLSLERTYYDRDGGAIEHSRILGRPDRCQQVVELFRVTGPFQP